MEVESSLNWIKLLSNFHTTFHFPSVVSIPFEYFVQLLFDFFHLFDAGGTDVEQKCKPFLKTELSLVASEDLVDRVRSLGQA